MGRYAIGLMNSFRDLETGHQISYKFPPPPWPIPRGMLLRRMIHYPHWAKRQQGDINHVLDHSYGILLKGLEPAQTIITFHDIAPLIFSHNRLGISLLTWRISLRYALRAAHIITVSNFTKKLLLKRLLVPEEKVTVIPNAPETIFKVLSTGQTEKLLATIGIGSSPYLFHVGSTEPRKNVEILLHSLAGLRKAGYAVSLIQAGGTPSSLQTRLVFELGLQDNVQFVGKISDDLLVALYNRAEVFVFPSLYEGFGIPPLEAMACGTPVVVSNRSSLPEVVGQAAVLVNPENHDEITSAVSGILDDNKKRLELQNRGLERAAQFSWRKSAQMTVEVYDKLAS